VTTGPGDCLHAQAAGNFAGLGAHGRALIMGAMSPLPSHLSLHVRETDEKWRQAPGYPPIDATGKIFFNLNSVYLRRVGLFDT